MTRDCRTRSRTAPLLCALSLASLCWCTRARAFIYPEHRQIGLAAWSKLSPEARTYYASLWQLARSDLHDTLCADPVAVRGPSRGRGDCIDLADWPAIAGDHSCSPLELVTDVLPSAWIHDVARVSAEVERALRDAENAEARENVWITSNLDLQGVDDAYVTRAGGNNAHFLLSRAGSSLREFVAESTRQGAPLNALGLYVQYHAAALRLASAIGGESSPASAALAQRVLALEAYALHFLQDMFASGHVAGTWGDAATRKGTHDYYCEHGYSTSDWTGRDLILFGDAHMRAADLERAATAIAWSMRQVFEVARVPRAPGTDWAQLDAQALEVATLDSCNQLEHPATIVLDRGESDAIEALLATTPKPGYGADSVGWPRYRADFGPFFGIESGISVGGAFGSYGGNFGRAVAELGIGLRVGFGLEGVVASLNTGTMFLHLGLVRQSEQVDLCGEPDCGHTLG